MAGRTCGGLQGTLTPQPVNQPKPASPRPPQLFPFGASPQGKPWERRGFFRYSLPLLLTVEARWNGRALLLERVPALENISAGGLYFCLPVRQAGLADGTSKLPPEDAELEITFPLVERTFHPARVYARCRARVLRRDSANRVAAQFDAVEFVREERLSGLPVPVSV